MLPDAISIASEMYFSTLTTPSDLPDIIPSDYTNTIHVMNKDTHFLGGMKRGYRFRKHDQIRCYKKTRLYCYTYSDKSKKIIIVMGFPGLIQIQGLASWEIKIICHNVLVDCCDFIPPILCFTC